MKYQISGLKLVKKWDVIELDRNYLIIAIYTGKQILKGSHVNDYISLFRSQKNSLSMPY